VATVDRIDQTKWVRYSDLSLSNNIPFGFPRCKWGQGVSGRSVSEVKYGKQDVDSGMSHHEDDSRVAASIRSIIVSLRLG
jgi:hypothetical protein